MAKASSLTYRKAMDKLRKSQMTHTTSSTQSTNYDEARRNFFPNMALGSASGLLGLPVDLVNMATQVNKPVMGSEWIGEKLRANTQSPAFQIGQFIDPLSATASMAKLGPLLLAGAVKNKGGNWLQKGRGSIEEALDPILAKVDFPTRPDNTVLRLPRPDGQPGVRIEERLPDGRFYTAFESDDVNYDPNALAPEERGINKWVKSKLHKYIQNDMGTPEDPIRRLMDEGISHTQNMPHEMAGLSHVYKRRKDMGFPEAGFATSDLGRRWEDLTDWYSMPDDAEWLRTDPRVIENNPWIEKLDPKAEVHSTLFEPRNLGFDHLTDEMFNMLVDSNLPRDLQLTVNQLDRVSVPDMVRLVDKVNKWRANNKLAANEEIRDYPDWNVVKEYPDGYRMVRLPNVADSEEAFKIGKACGEKGGWCTQDDSNLHRYGSGGSRLNILLDPDGKPVAQVETSKETPFEIDFDTFSDSEVESFRGNWPYPHDERPRGIHANDEYDYYADGTIDTAKELFPDRVNYLTEPTFSIRQIKGKYNQKPKAEHIPYLQDFVKSGNFSDVVELDNVDLFKNGSSYSTRGELIQHKSFVDFMIDRGLNPIDDDDLSRGINYWNNNQSIGIDGI